MFGTKGLVSVENIPEHAAVHANASGIHQARLQYSFPERFHRAFQLEMDAFGSVVLDKKQWPISAHQCVLVQQIVDAARESSATGCVVYLDTL